MKLKKCKSCQKEFMPYKYASCKTKCKDCIFAAHKKKMCAYQKKQLENKKPTKPIKVKIDAQWTELSDFIKQRDTDLPCISCNKQMKPHEIQAGHYIARSKSRRLKYEPRNIHAQCWNCNNNHQIQQQVQEGFRKGLIARIGFEKVRELEEEKKRAGRYSL